MRGRALPQAALPAEGGNLREAQGGHAKKDTAEKAVPYEKQKLEFPDEGYGVGRDSVEMICKKFADLCTEVCIDGSGAGVFCDCIYHTALFSRAAEVIVSGFDELSAKTFSAGFGERVK